MTQTVKTATLLWTDASLTSQALFFDLVEEEDWRGGAVVTDYPVERGPSVTDNVRPQTDRCTLRVYVSNSPLKGNFWARRTDGTIEVDAPLPTLSDPGSGIVQYQVWENNIELRAVGAMAIGLAGGLGGATAGAVAAIAGSAALAAIPGVAVPVATVTDAGIYQDNVRRTSALLRTQVPVKQFAESEDFVAKTLALLDDLKAAAQLFSVEGSKKSVDNMVIEELSHRRNSDAGTGALITIGLREIRMVSTQNVPSPAPEVVQTAPPVSHGAQSTTDANDKQGVLWGLVHH